MANESGGYGPKGPSPIDDFPAQRVLTSVAMQAPMHSVDARDWQVFTRQLQSAAAPDEQIRRAQRIAESLARDPKLVLINYCPAEALGRHPNNHWLRVGRTWFIGAPGTFIEGNKLSWWRIQWVRDGFRRYPTDDPDRVEDDLINLNYGNPWKIPHPRFNLLLEKQSQDNLILGFFETHSLLNIPQDYQ